MAERRMFTKKITDSDAFISLSSSAQALYLHLLMSADDDGFSNQVRRSMFQSHASQDDLQVLIAKGFIIVFESGVIVIRHWNLHNSVKNDRKKDTVFQDELSQLGVTENKVYTECIQNGSKMVPKCIQSGTIGKDSIGKDSIGKDSIGKNNKRFVKPTISDIQSYATAANLNISAEEFYDYYESNGWKVGKNPMKDWKATLRGWARRESTFRKKDTSNYKGVPRYVDDADCTDEGDEIYG